MTEQPQTAINTYSGKVIDFASPDPAEIDIRDIAWRLSRICRFGAQSLAFYSVAQHAVTVSQIVERMGHSQLALAALHHDSHEGRRRRLRHRGRGVAPRVAGRKPACG